MPEILIIAFLILLLFGAKKIPEFMKNIGSGMKEFKKAVNPDEQKETAVTKKEDNEEIPVK